MATQIIPLVDLDAHFTSRKWQRCLAFVCPDCINPPHTVVIPISMGETRDLGNGRIPGTSHDKLVAAARRGSSVVWHQSGILEELSYDGRILASGLGIALHVISRYQWYDCEVVRKTDLICIGELNPRQLGL